MSVRVLLVQGNYKTLHESCLPSALQKLLFLCSSSSITQHTVCHLACEAIYKMICCCKKVYLLVMHILVTIVGYCISN